jgi:hypothetical protein
MRALLLTLLAVSGLAFASSATSLPHGDDRFLLGMTRNALDKHLAERQVETISDFNHVLATTSDDPAIEYERYRFVPSPHLEQPDILAEATFGWRVPYDRATFDAAADLLRGRLGDPTDEVHSADLDRLIWTDGLVTVQLAARWTPVQDVNADRMLLTWTDLRLRQSSDAARKAPKKPKK